MPNYGVAGVCDHQSFEVWSQGPLFQMKNWHFYSDYKLCLITGTKDERYVGDHVGSFCREDLVLVGPNLPNKWISDTLYNRSSTTNYLTLKFTEQFVNGCMTIFPDLRFIQGLLSEARHSILFKAATVKEVKPLMRKPLWASSGRRIRLFIEILNIIAHATHRSPLTTIRFKTSPPDRQSTAMNMVLHHIRCHLTNKIPQIELAHLSRQNVSALSRSFRKQTGVTLVQYISTKCIELACQDLYYLDISVRYICYKVGFRSVSSFNRQFSRLMGMPPLKFRSLQRVGQNLVTVA